MNVIDYVLALLRLLPELIKLRADIREILAAEAARIQGWRDAGVTPTQADFDALNALQAPIEAGIQTD